MAFDPKSFLNLELTESTSTESIPVPEGFYKVNIEKVDIMGGESEKTDSGLWASLKLACALQDNSLVEGVTKRPKNTVQGDIFLELTSTGALALGQGQNVQLGKLREAVGQNKPGKAWSPTMLKGQSLTIQVKHKIVEEVPFAEVKKFLPYDYDPNSK